MRKPPLRKRLASTLSTEGVKSIGVKRTPTSKVNFYSEGGDTMATKMKMFEKSGMDKDKGMKEGSKKDMKMDKKQMPAFLMKGKGMKSGGKAMKKGGKC